MVWDTRAAEKVQGEVNAVLDNSPISLDDIRSQGMTVRIGGRVVKLEISQETSIPEDDIREEYKRLLTAKLQQIKTVLNEKMSEYTYMVEQNKADFEEKERALQARLASANIMPDITYSHAQQGLSLVKGNKDKGRSEKDVLTWLYQGVYWPKYYDNKPIDPKYSKRMITPITLEICTQGDRVTFVKVRKTLGLSKFEHYHGMSGDNDCWGQWNPTALRWKTPDDIIKIGKDALAILENINPMSPANRTPAGLPRMDTLSSHVLTGAEARSLGTGRGDERAGVSEAARTGWDAQF